MLTRDALSFLVAAAMLAGCDGLQPQASPKLLAPDIVRSVSPIRSDSELAGETFSSTQVNQNACYFNSQSGLVQIDFEASGKASGPFPGTFTVHGFIGRASAAPDLLVGVGIREHFYIISNSQKISGRVYLLRDSDVHRFGCTRNLKGNFDISHLKYQAKDLPGHGYTTQTLKANSFRQSFQ